MAGSTRGSRPARRRVGLVLAGTIGASLTVLSSTALAAPAAPAARAGIAVTQLPAGSAWNRVSTAQAR
jgi:hypothetical protein